MTTQSLFDIGIKTRSVEQYKNDVLRWASHSKSSKAEYIRALLDDVNRDIEYLEVIYRTGDQYHCYSDQLKQAAHAERQDLCNLTSACYSLLREQEVQP